MGSTVGVQSSGGSKLAREAIGNEEPEEELEEGDEDLEELDDPEEVAAGLAMAPDDDEESDDASLEELLAQRSAGRRASSDSDEEDDDIMSLSSEPALTGTEVIRTKVIPVKDRQEFVCKRCYLVKARSQLSDEERMLCRDCV